MTTLDRTRPYAEVWGAGGQFCYEQDGRQFRLDGEAREADPAPDPAPEAAPEATPAKVAPKGRAAAKAPDPAPDPAPEAAPELAKLPDADLRSMVEIAGGQWSGREAALAFLAEEN